MADIIGIQWVNPLSVFGQLSPWVLTSSIIAVIGCLVAGIFIYLYYKKYYVGEVPKGWKMFFIGLILIAVYQILKIPFTYGWIFGNINVLLFLIFQVVAVGFLAYGLYLLKKGVSV
jgi:hypothetical protein